MTRPVLSRRSVIASLPAVGLTRAAQARVAGSDPTLAFVAVGDWGRNGANHQRAVAEQMGRAATEIGSQFVAALGDNFYERGVTSAQDPQWRSSFEDVYTAPSLQIPWYAILGNHDYLGAPEAEIEYAQLSSRWRMPDRYYKVEGASLSAPHVDLFFLDTSPLVHSYRRNVASAIARNVASQDAAEQLAWLDRELGRSQAPWKFVFGHHTIYSGGLMHGNTTELVQQVLPILQRRGVQAYINGHEHDLQHLRIGGMDFICSGAGSEVRPTGPIEGTRFALSRSGFASFKVARDSLELEFRDYAGASVYRTVVTRAQASPASP